MGKPPFFSTMLTHLLKCGYYFTENFQDVVAV